MMNQSVEIVVVDDDLLEPQSEGFRLLIVVDELRTPLSQVRFDRQIALFRIDDATDSKSYFTYAIIARHVFIYFTKIFISAITFGFENEEIIIDDTQVSTLSFLWP